MYGSTSTRKGEVQELAMMKNLKWCRAAAGVVVVVAAMLCLAGTPAQATEVEVKAALDLVPADAPIVLVVPNVARASKKIAGLGQTLGIDSPEMADVLGMIKKQSGIAAGVRDDGPIVIAILDAQDLRDRIAGKVPDNTPPAILAAIPITDFQTFLGNFPGHTGDAVVTIKLKDDNDDTYVAQAGDFAILSPHRERVAGYKPAQQSGRWVTAMGKPAAKCLETSDALVLVNVAELSPALQPKIQEFMDMLAGNMDMGAGAPGMDAASLAWMKTVLTIYGDVATALVRDTAMYTEAIDLSDKGVGLTVGVQLKPDSKLAAIFHGGGGSNEVLTRLPKDNYLMALAGNFQGIDLKTLVDDALGALPADNKADAIGSMMRPAVENLRRVQAMAQVMYAPTPGKGMGQGGLINAVSIAMTDDAQAWMKANRQALEQMGKLNPPAAGANPAANPGDKPGADPAAGGDPAPAPGANPIEGMSFATKYTEKVLRVDDIDVDQYQVSVTFPPAMMQGNKMAGVLQMLGVTSQTGYICASGKYVITTSSSDLTLIKRTLATIKDQSGIGAAPLLAQTRKEGLPEDPAAQMYLSVNGLGSIVNMVVPLLGGPAIALPNDLPPVALGVAVDQGAVVGRWYVPMPVITAVKHAIDQFQPHNNPQRPHPAGPGGPPAPPM
jgi:hypothetical protein